MGLELFFKIVRVSDWTLGKITQDSIKSNENRIHFVSALCITSQIYTNRIISQLKHKFDADYLIELPSSLSCDNNPHDCGYIQTTHPERGFMHCMHSIHVAIVIKADNCFPPACSSSITSTLVPFISIRHLSWQNGNCICALLASPPSSTNYTYSNSFSYTATALFSAVPFKIKQVAATHRKLCLYSTTTVVVVPRNSRLLRIL